MLAVFDMDGVVADVRHRLHHLRRQNWSRFFAAADADPLLAEGAAWSPTSPASTRSSGSPDGRSGCAG